MIDLLQQILIRPLREDEPVPFALLLDADPYMGAITGYLETSEIFVALLNDEIIAEYVLYPLTPDSFEIKNIAVKEGLQGKGIGKLLLDHATGVAISRGASTIVISTSNASIDALYIYQKNGFIMTGIKFNFILENYPEKIYDYGIQCRHLLTMTKELK